MSGPLAKASIAPTIGVLNERAGAPEVRCHRRLNLDPWAALGFRACRNTALIVDGVGMGRRGRKRRLEVEARYWQLVQSGVGTVTACRQVGITRKTGYRWRAEAGGVVPLRLADAVRSNRYLSLVERQRIGALHLSVRGTLVAWTGTHRR